MKYLLRDFDFPFEITPCKKIIGNGDKKTDAGINRILGDQAKNHSQTQGHHGPKTQEKCGTRELGTSGKPHSTGDF